MKKVKKQIKLLTNAQLVELAYKALIESNAVIRAQNNDNCLVSITDALNHIDKKKGII